MSGSQTTEDWRETDPYYYRMIADEGLNARHDNLSPDDCPYQSQTIERFYWMDGYDD